MNVLIVDDEQLARQRLQHMLSGIDGFDVVGEADNGEKALAQIAALHPDIVLMDIRMPGMDGMEAARKIAESAELQCRVIFTTAYDDHALEAFDAQASGYLLKPVNKEKLEQALQRAARLDVQKPVANNGRKHLSSSTRGNVELIALEDVRLLMAEHKYVTVYHLGGESILDDSLRALEEEFPDRFTRIHRNALVSTQHILALEKNRGGQYEMEIADIDIKPLVSRRLLTQIRGLMKRL